MEAAYLHELKAQGVRCAYCNGNEEPPPTGETRIMLRDSESVSPRRRTRSPGSIDFYTSGHLGPCVY